MREGVDHHNVKVQLAAPPLPKPTPADVSREPVWVMLRGPEYQFQAYGVHQAKQLGLIDSWEREGTHAPISTIFEHGDGKLLADWVANMPDALLIATGRHQITVYRPKSRLIEIPPDDEPET